MKARELVLCGLISIATSVAAMLIVDSIRERRARASLPQPPAPGLDTT